MENTTSLAQTFGPGDKGPNVQELQKLADAGAKILWEGPSLTIIRDVPDKEVWKKKKRHKRKKA